MAYGVTTTGWVSKPLDTIKQEIETSLRGIFGAGINLVPMTVFSQWIGVLADREADLWQMGEDVYTSFDPYMATGQALVARGLMRRLSPNSATYTKVTAVVSGTNGTVIGTGTQFSVIGTGVKFATLAPATIASGTATIACQALLTGPFPCYAGTLTVIETPIAGMTSVTNPADHTVIGSNVESDAAFRVRMTGVGNEGSKYVAAIRAKVLAVANVTDCFVFNNTSDGIDSNGLVAHSIGVVVAGGVDADIAAAILSCKPEGITTNGATSVTVVDSQGFNVAVKFDRPTTLQVYVDINVKIDSTGQFGTAFPADGDTQIKQAVANFGDDNYHVGSQCIASRLEKEVFGIDGVRDVVSLFIGLSAWPGTAVTISPTFKQIVNLDTSQIRVNHV